MNEVKKADIALVTNALAQYLDYINKVRQVNLQEFVNFIEQVFTKAGYRENPKGGGVWRVVKFFY